MQRLIQGIHHFQNQVFHEKKELFNELANGQSPSTLFITCSDSRVNPNLVTQSEPGEIFVIRNAGNIVPPSPEFSGELASIEFAIRALKIKDIVVCGHSDCGAMKGVLDPHLTEGCPAVSRWLRNAKRTSEIIKKSYSHLTGEARLMAAIEENVLVQIENLRSHPIIEENLSNGTLNIHGWVYKFERGEMYTYDYRCGQYTLMPRHNDDVCPVYPRVAEHAPILEGQSAAFSVAGARQ